MLHVRPRVGTKTRRSYGRTTYRYCALLGYSLYDDSVAIMGVKPSEKNLDKGRFKNFSLYEFENKVDIEILSANNLSTHVVRWLRYDTESWSIRVSKDSPVFEYQGKATVTTGSKLILSFKRPKDALIFLLYKEEIFAGTRMTRRTRYVAPPLTEAP